MNRTFAFIQARMSSSRFPGKVVEPLDGLPLVVYMARRAQRAMSVHQVVVLTSRDPSDDPLEAVLRAHGVPLFRGDLNDVLGRFAEAAAMLGADEVVRLTGDCPLIDPAIIDAVVTVRRSTAADYASNVDPPTFPDGLDVECFTRGALERADRAAREPEQREHVTPWMRSEAAGLQRALHHAIADLSHIRLTIDHPDDLQAVRQLLATLRPGTQVPDLYDLLRGLAMHPEILAINPHARNEGLAVPMGSTGQVSPTPILPGGST